MISVAASAVRADPGTIAGGVVGALIGAILIAIIIVIVVIVVIRVKRSEKHTFKGKWCMKSRAVAM